VSNVHYDASAFANAQNDVLPTPYYSTRPLPAGGPLVANFHDITISNLSIQGETGVKSQGFAANTGGLALPAYPLMMSLT
jgi:polygalacturonase